VTSDLGRKQKRICCSTDELTRDQSIVNRTRASNQVPLLTKCNRTPIDCARKGRSGRVKKEKEAEESEANLVRHLHNKPRVLLNTARTPLLAHGSLDTKVVLTLSA
jgi:hypothetical protein